MPMIRPDFPGQAGKKHNALAGRADELIHSLRAACCFSHARCNAKAITIICWPHARVTHHKRGKASYASERLRGHTDYVHAVDWSPDGTRLVSGSGDFTVRIRDSLSPADRAKESK